MYNWIEWSAVRSLILTAGAHNWMYYLGSLLYGTDYVCHRGKLLLHSIKLCENCSSVLRTLNQPETDLFRETQGFMPAEGWKFLIYCSLFPIKSFISQTFLSSICREKTLKWQFCVLSRNNFIEKCHAYGELHRLVWLKIEQSRNNTSSIQEE